MKLSTDYVEEVGPEAAATVARLRDVELVLAGEGETVYAGEDGDTSCVHFDSGSAWDVLSESEEVSESDWRLASRVLRFSMRDDRDQYITGLPIFRDARVEGPLRERRDDYQPRPVRLEFIMSAGLSSTEAVLEVEARSDSIVGRYRVTSSHPELAQSADVDLPQDEWARFLEELELLRVKEWRRFGAQAFDGLSWSFRGDSFLAVDAGGDNAYPPNGEGPEYSPQFLRLVLVFERLLGQRLWPEVDFVRALSDIPDERDRIEHLILAALRAWGDELRTRGIDPNEMDERVAQGSLVPHIEALGPCRQNVSLRGMLVHWPGVGPLDVEVGESDRPAWVELKWCKGADTFHNCLWDAAKLTTGLREERAAYGYLLAGAPEREWERLSAPSRLFEVSNHTGDSLVRSFPSWWQFWEKENQKTYPLRLPMPVLTVPVGQVRLVPSKGEPWLVRLSRVESPGAATYNPRDIW